MSRIELAKYLLKNSQANYQYFDRVMRIYKLLEILRKVGFRWHELNISTYSDLKKITEDGLSKQLLSDLEGLKLSDQNYFEFVNNYVKESKD